MLTRIQLGGYLAEFGRDWNLDLDVPSPAEAVRALRAVCPGFRDKLNEQRNSDFHVFVGSADIGSDDLQKPSGAARITIMPALAGAGGGIWQTIAGGVLIVGAVAIGVLSGGTLLNVALAVGSLGASLLLGGVSQLLAGRPEIASDAKKQNDPNYVFSGPVNTVGTGFAVPICYGKLEIGSHVISARITTVSPAINIGQLPGAGYVPGSGELGDWHIPPWKTQDGELP